MLMNRDSTNTRLYAPAQRDTTGYGGTKSNVKGLSQGEVKRLIGGLKNDGIIVSGNYEVLIHDNKLFVDGVEQAAEVNEKYKKYIDGKADFVIREHKK